MHLLLREMCLLLYWEKWQGRERVGPVVTASFRVMSVILTSTYGLETGDCGRSLTQPHAGTGFDLLYWLQLSK
jgi:hypothetical protein